MISILEYNSVVENTLVAMNIGFYKKIFRLLGFDIRPFTHDANGYATVRLPGITVKFGVKPDYEHIKFTNQIYVSGVKGNIIPDDLRKIPYGALSDDNINEIANILKPYIDEYMTKEYDKPDPNTAYFLIKTNIYGEYMAICPKDRNDYDVYRKVTKYTFKNGSPLIFNNSTKANKFAMDICDELGLNIKFLKK